MILVDANILIYAVDEDSPHHRRAKAWLEGALSSDMDVALSWIVILAFVRITTHPSIMRAPLAAEAALTYVGEWLNQPYVTIVGPGERHWAILTNLLQLTGTAGNLTSDAHLAALALEHGCEVYSADHDFQRFPAVLHVNPLTVG